jgi:hypothetical protein
MRQSRNVGRGGLRQPGGCRDVEIALYQLFDQVASELRMAGIALRGRAVMIGLRDFDAGRQPFFLLLGERNIVDVSPKHTMKAGIFASSNTSIWSLPTSTATSGRTS